MKICATTLGETAGDLLSMTLNVGYATSTLILMGIFVVALVAQLSSKKYHPFLYWAVILATSTAGTTMSDFMDRTLELGYAKGAAILVGLLVISLVTWRYTMGTLAVQTITSRRVELFYWITVLLSNTLGTAVGDFLSDDSGLGFRGGAMLIGSILVVIILAMRFTPVSRVFLFWLAFVLTRPFGAELGDLLTKSTEKGGLNLGTINSSLVLASILVVVIAYSTRRSRPEE